MPKAVGVRLHHPTLRSCVYTLLHEGRPLRFKPGAAQPVCAVCLTTHTVKTYHLWLDGQGDTVVSEVVFERIKEAGLDELKVLGQVEPEPLVVGLGTPVREAHVVAREKKGIKDG